ncbi:MAG: hypothetical protein JNK04_01780 [Myxococcales bacterium]|nr:hypothetical protein [Myxococcales bacterium]
METKKHFRMAGVPLVLAAILAPVAAAPGCDGANPLDALCCTEFKPGTNMLAVDWGIEDATVNARFGAAIQAIGDFSGTATAIVTDLGTLCRNMAVELGESPDAVTTDDPGDYATQWCDKAATVVASVKAQGSIQIDYQEPQCSFSVEASAGCEAHCDVSGSCDPGSVEVRCTGGELSVKCEGELSCHGKCEGSANVAVSCSGACSGECNGTCDGTASNGASCAGQCEGECRGSCDVSGGAGVECEGECVGEAACSGTATAPKCTGQVDPPSCDIDADCQASCDASASAKAECTPPAVTITGAAEFKLQIGVLKKYLPEILLLAEARLPLLQANVDALIDVSANLDGAFEGDGAAVFCLVPAGAAVIDAGENISIAFTASASVGNAVKN